MTNERALDHLETAVKQRDPARRLRLAALALEAEASNPAALGLVALSLPDLARAAPLLERAAAAARDPRSLAGMSAELRLVVEAVRATRDLVGLDAHAAAERALPALRVAGDGPVAAPLLRIAMAACAATGDAEGLAVALKEAGKRPGILQRETAWFRYLLAHETRNVDAGMLLDAAQAVAGDVASGLAGASVSFPKPGNPGAFEDAASEAAPARAAVLPGLFRAGGIPDTLPLAA